MKYTVLGFLVLTLVQANLRDNANKIYIGTGILSTALVNDNQYMTIANQQFNSYSSLDQSIWSTVEQVRGTPNYTLMDQLIQFGNGSKIRGGPLLWHLGHPSWLNSIQNNKNALNTSLVNYISGLVNHTNGSMYAWEVAKELVAENGQYRASIWTRHFGGKNYVNFIGQLFRIANSVDPNAKLYINDYDVYGDNKRKTEEYYNLVRTLKAQGVPIHGVGFECHLTAGRFPSTLATTMLRFAELGLDVAITGLDVRVRLPVTAASLTQQAKDYAQAINICTSISRCVGVTTWQLTDKYSYFTTYPKNMGAANLWDSNYNPKPAVNYTASVIQ